MDQELNDIVNIRSADEETPFWIRFINYFGTSLVASIIFLLLSWKPVDDYFTREIPDKRYRLVAKALILFIFVYISNRIIVRNIQKRYKERMKIKLIDLINKIEKEHRIIP